MPVNQLITFQTFDNDPSRGSVHVLLDRVGIYSRVGYKYATGALMRMIDTQIDLPLDDDKLSRLMEMLQADGERVAAQRQIVEAHKTTE